MMTEEFLTKTILQYLEDYDWNIICYDYPQSGTGIYLHPDGTTDKNKDSICPDIVAVKNGICLFFENKTYYYKPDFEKVHRLITTDIYKDAINELLSGYQIKSIYYGVGLPHEVFDNVKQSDTSMVDFIVTFHSGEGVQVPYFADKNITIG